MLNYVLVNQVLTKPLLLQHLCSLLLAPAVVDSSLTVAFSYSYVVFHSTLQRLFFSFCPNTTPVLKLIGYGIDRHLQHNSKRTVVQPPHKVHVRLYGCPLPLEWKHAGEIGKTSICRIFSLAASQPAVSLMFTATDIDGFPFKRMSQHAGVQRERAGPRHSTTGIDAGLAGPRPSMCHLDLQHSLVIQISPRCHRSKQKRCQ